MIDYPNNCYRKVMKGQRSKNLQFCAQRWSKFTQKKLNKIWFFVNHPAVHNGELAGGGSVAVPVGVSDMLQVTGDSQHMTHDT